MTIPKMKTNSMDGAIAVPVTRWQRGVTEDWVANEVPVALVYNGISHAVMMCTPKDLEAFGVGFTLSEGIVPSLDHIYGVEVQEACQGFEVHLEISSEMFWHLKDRRRSMAGRTGCGLCGTESLEGAVRQVSTLAHTQTWSMAHYEKGLAYLNEVEVLGQQTGCTHAAVWLSPSGECLVGCEDVGRHVALDKLIGLRAQQGVVDGVCFVSSRASFEMVQKCAQVGIEVLFAMSAPTALAVDLAQRTHLTLVAFCRPGRCNIYTHPERLIES